MNDPSHHDVSSMFRPANTHHDPFESNCIWRQDPRLYTQTFTEVYKNPLVYSTQ